MKHLIVIGGPTASGKTALAIAVARHFGTEIVSADSRQFYREMRIGNARPTPEELAEVPHHFIADRSISNPLSAGRFADEAVERLRLIYETHAVAVAVGGSGLYLKALCDGLDTFPVITGAAERRVQAITAQAGLAGLQAALLDHDPEYHARVDLLNARRIERALKVSFSAAAPYSSYLGQGVKRNFVSHKFALRPDRNLLYEQIDRRVDKMVEEGLQREALTLVAHRELPILQTVGYQEWWPVVDGAVSIAAAVDSIKRNSRRYAKRQLTWFKKFEATQSIADVDELLKYVSTQVNN